jgi:hypothetical protein
MTLPALAIACMALLCAAPTACRAQPVDARKPDVAGASFHTPPATTMMSDSALLRLTHACARVAFLCAAATAAARSAGQIPSGGGGAGGGGGGGGMAATTASLGDGRAKITAPAAESFFDVQGCTLRLPQAGAAYKRIDVRCLRCCALALHAERISRRADVRVRPWSATRAPSSCAHVRACDTAARRRRAARIDASCCAHHRHDIRHERLRPHNGSAPD